MDTSNLDRELYTYGEVDRYLELAPGTARRWINGYQRNGRFYEPVVRVASLGEHRLVTWGEMVEVFYLAAFRDRKHSMQSLRPVVMALRNEHGDYPFARERVLYSDDTRRQVVRAVTGDVIEDVVTRQYSFLENAEERLHRVEFEGGLVAAFAPVHGLTEIILAADTESGAPHIKGTGVRPHSVARLVQAGDDVEDVASWFGLSARQVDQAGIFTFRDKWRLAA